MSKEDNVYHMMILNVNRYANVILERSLRANEGHIGVNESVLTIMKQIWTLMNGYFLEMNSKRCRVFSSLRNLQTSPVMYQSIPKPPTPPPQPTPRHLTRVKLRTVGNLTQNEARPVGHLTFLSKRLSVVGNERISQFFDSARERRSKVIALVDSTWVVLLLYFV